MSTTRHTRIAPLLAALLMLVAAVAPAICRTSSSETGRSVVDIGHVQSCCDNDVPSDVPELRPVCCAHTEAAADVNDHTFNTPEKLNMSLPLIAVLHPVDVPLLTSTMVLERADRAPPFKAPERLSRFCSLLL
jgi:hypothetical protein